ncbi:MAG TPA: nuclear transport factor 2 family protein [Acidimicrobiales bacterium]|nr:nuclear transport factor 2 family protein [Acidimicrobiales bacterium]
MTQPGENLATLLGVWVAMLDSGRTEELAAILDENVVWQGVLPELVCNGRQQVIQVLAGNGRRFPRITGIEAREIGERVAVSVEGPDFSPGPAGASLEPATGPRSLVFTFEGGKVVRMDSLPTRDAAFGLVQRT